MSVHEFLTESLKCLNCDKVAAAYCLLRRPCKDEYVLLDHLLKDGNTFAKELRILTPESLDALLKEGPKLFDDGYFNLMYALIFNKSCSASLDKVWNKAAHIVTTYKHHPSMQSELNFITISPEQKELLRTDYLAKVSVVITGIHKIAYSIFCNIYNLDTLVKSWMLNLIDYKLAIVSKYPDFDIPSLEVLTSVILRNLGGECLKCGDNLSIPNFLIINKSLSHYSFTYAHCKHRQTLDSLCTTVLNNEHKRRISYQSRGRGVPSLYSQFETE